MPPRTILDLQRESRAAITADADAAIALAESEGRALTAEETELVQRTAAEVAPLDATIAATSALRSGAAAAAPAAVGGAIVRSAPMTYRERGEHSHIRDCLLARTQNDTAAWERLRRHAHEVEVEQRDISRVDGAGGEFVPPLWLLDQYGDFPRSGRVLANLVTSIPLPPGTDSVNLPRITTGPQMGIQTADNGAVTETDMATTSVAVPIRTLAGQQDLAIQLIEQSPLGAGMDALIYSQLSEDYELQLGAQLWNGSGASGQVLGFLQTGSINSVSYTDGSPTVPELYLPLSQAVSKVHTVSKVRASAIVMVPYRWNWMLSALDSNNRPLVVPAANGPYMSLGVQNESAAEGGPVGTVLGLPVYLDGTGPLTLGGGTEDAIIAARFSDAVLMEGAVRTRVLPDVGSGTLTVRFQLYRYVGFTAGRRPQSVSKVTGTGLAAPSGF